MKINEKVSLVERIANGEDSYTQFKVNTTNANKLAGELVAFSNARGGLLIIGVDDKGVITGLHDEDTRRINQLIGNVINTCVIPPIYPLVKIETIEDKKILTVEIDEGSNKPYSTNAGIYLTKAGSDKRKISPQELRRLFAESKNLYPDEEIVHNSDIDDLDIHKLRKFLKQDNIGVLKKLDNDELNLETVLTNLELLRGNQLTLAGNLLFGETPQRFNPSFYIDCCYFDGNDISVTKFISKKTIKGTFDELYEDSFRFVISQLRTYQVEKDFNSTGELEVKEEVLSELIVNALIHRDYYIQSSIKVFIFHNRIEIISPGKLTNSLTVEKIKNGIAVQRNPILSSISKTLLPYTGYGSGIRRVLALNPAVEFLNDIDMEQFKSIIYRSDSPKSENTRVESENTRVESENTRVESENTRVESKDTRVEIVKFLEQDSAITLKDLARRLNISPKGVEWHIKKLKDENKIKRVGPNKGGHWEIIDEI